MRTKADNSDLSSFVETLKADRIYVDIHFDANVNLYRLVDNETGEILHRGFVTLKEAQEYAPKTNWCSNCFCYRFDGPTCGTCGNLLS